MVVRGHPSLSLTRQCRLLSIGRSSLYDRPKGESAETLALMRRIDALFLKYPFYGARQMVRHLRREGVRIGRRRAARLMRLLGLQAVYRAPRTSAPHLGHRVYPYLLRGLAIERPNHVWCADITYIPVRRGFLYLVAIMDWASRCVLAWRLSNTLDAGFCVEALDEALARHGTPQIFNTDQGSQFTGFAFTARLREAGIRISMDGRGRCMDNIFIERLWRSLKYEAVYLHEIADGFAARRVIGQWIGFYNTERPHSALGGRTPAEAYRGDTPVDMMDKPLRALTTYPQAQQQQQKDRSKRILAAQTSTGIHLENAVSLSDKPTPPHPQINPDPIAVKSKRKAKLNIRSMNSRGIKLRENLFPDSRSSKISRLVEENLRSIAFLSLHSKIAAAKIAAALSFSSQSSFSRASSSSTTRLIVSYSDSSSIRGLRLTISRVQGWRSRFRVSRAVSVSSSEISVSQAPVRLSWAENLFPSPEVPKFRGSLMKICVLLPS